MSDKKRIVVTFVEAGQGHLVTAEAIADFIEKEHGDKIEVIRLWPFRNTEDIKLKNYEEFLIKEVKKSNKSPVRMYTQCFAMKLLTEQGTLKFVHSTVFRNVQKKVINIYEKINPDMIISTYYSTYHFGIQAKKQGKLKNCIMAAYDPDTNVHGWWDRFGDLFFVNNEGAVLEAKKRHHKPESIRLVNFMMRQNVEDVNGTKAEYRKKWNLPQDKFTVVLADGAYAAAKLPVFTKELLKTKKELTIIPVCGRNEKLFNEYQKLAADGKIPKNITFLPLPFVKDIAEIYRAADLFITKAGPNAIIDCLFMGTPIMANYLNGPIEKAVIKLFIKHHKTGVYCKNPIRARMLIEKYVDNPELLLEYRKNCIVCDKSKNGAKEIADIVAKELKI